MTDVNRLPLTSSHWGTYRVKTENGRVKALYGFEEDDDASPIGQSMIGVQDGTTRIKTPAVRQSWLESGPGSNNASRGAEPFVAVSWETAEKLVADELARTRERYGNSAIYAGSYGWASAGRFHHAQSQIHRFLNCIGGYTRSVDTYSFAAAEVIVPHILGNFYGFLAYATSWPSIIEHARLFVAFGGVPLKNGQINAGGVGRHTQRENIAAARAAGIEFVNISPVRSDVGELVQAEWLALRPSTDTAMLLGIALHGEQVVAAGIGTALVTGTERDGVLGGPNTEILETARGIAPDLSLIASGGVGSLDDLAMLRDRGYEAAIVGRALYENQFTLEEALGVATS